MPKWRKSRTQIICIIRGLVPSSSSIYTKYRNIFLGVLSAKISNFQHVRKITRVYTLFSVYVSLLNPDCQSRLKLATSAKFIISSVPDWFSPSENWV